MNASRIIQRGHQSFLDILKDLPEKNWTDGMVTGSWTVRDVVAHLATYEGLQVETFRKFLDPAVATPLLDQKAKGNFSDFNQERSEELEDQPWQDVLKDYMNSYVKLKEIVEAISPETMAKPGTTVWYGEPSPLDDVIALNFGHKKHHLAQIKLFRQQNGI